MRAVVCTEFGSIDYLAFRDIPDPGISNGCAIVQIHAAGINFTDVLLVEGRSQLRKEPPITPGVEFSGVIIAVADDVQHLRVGQRVLGVCNHGAYAERICVSAEELWPIPDEMEFVTAACFYIASFTSRYALQDRAKLTSHEALLVLGAGGGAGQAAVSIGKALGAYVVAAASSREKLDAAERCGADEVFQYRSVRLAKGDQIELNRALTAISGDSKRSPVSLGDISTVAGNRGFDVIFDGVGGTYTEPALRALAYDGRYLSVGFAAGVPSPSLGPALFKNANIMGIQPAADNIRLPGRNPEAMTSMLSWWRQGALVPEITKTYPLEHAVRALRDLKERRATGRIVLKINGA